jgi:anti-sigma factor RsiW
MHCDEIRPLLPALADHELSAAQSIEVERHLASCADCRHEYARQNALATATRQHASYHQAPTQLRQRIIAVLPQDATQPDRVRPRWRGNWLHAGAALASVCALAWSLGLYLTLPSAGERLAEDVLASHVRSLITNNIAQVASSDQHTVKPWFNGKLDFSPPVRDFAAQGFPLIGGRLDYVNQRPVAALVYQRNKHVINVYVWPDAAQDQAAVQARSRQGYHMLNWRARGMAYWAISDLNQEELAQFRANWSAASAQ